MRRRPWAFLTCGLAALGLTACQEVLTPNGGQYAAAGAPGALSVTNTQSGGNEREVFYASSSPSESSSSECETWESGQGAAQNGIAFRIRYAEGGWQDVTLERNIWMNGFWAFVIIYFNTGQPGYFTVGPSVYLNNYLGENTQQDVFPLQVCASINSSDVLSFAVAKQGDAMPALGTPGQGGTIQLDPALVPPSGPTGTYVAHVPPGTSATVDGITIDGQPAPNPTS